MIGTVRPKAPEPERDTWGRPYVVPAGGGKAVPYTRCTTYVGAIEDMYLVQRWQQRHVAKGIAGHPDLIQAVMRADPEDKSGLNDLVDEALTRSGAGDAAKVGTWLHSATEALDRGEDPSDVETPLLSTGPLNPSLYDADLDAYQRATAGLEAVQIEQFVVQDLLKVGGTPDRIVRHQGKRYVSDLKTGEIKWGTLKIAAQIAMYARSRPYDVTTGERLDHHGAEVDKGLVIHLPAGTGTCTIWWIDLTAGWDAVRVCREVRNQRQRKFPHLTQPFTQTEWRTPVNLSDLIAAAQTRDEVVALWQIHLDVWTEAHTDLATRRVAELAGNTAQQQQPA